MRSFVWREFLSSKGEEYEEIEDGSELKLGDAPMAPPSKYQEPSRVKAWGCPRHPLIFIDYHKVVFFELHFYHFTYYVLCLEHLFTFSLFVCWSYLCLDIALFVWERDTLRFFVWILLCFAYILLSILSYYLFSSKLSLLAFILFRSASCYVKLSCSSLILVGELLLKNCLNCQCDKMLFVWW